ncbi:MAG: lmo0937 family membrane protein [Longimicrobiaceae bacterium]
MTVNTLIWIAVILVVVWIVAKLVGFVAGALLNLLWIIALVLLVIWLFQKVF